MKYLKIVLVLILAASCQDKNDMITNPADYNAYLKTQESQTTSKYFRLWDSKIKSDSTQLLSFANVAGEYNRFFKNTGDISYLKKAEQVLTKAVEIANIGKASYARALARNFISQHRFKEALEMADLADQLGGGKKDTQALLFDVHMELGNYGMAEQYLDSIKHMSDFGYLIRNAKWNDYKGDLDTTIKFMEKALKLAESSKNRNLQLWSYTNLADYYGHAGRIQDSYKGYLKALALDPNNAYAKKGIAWIAFSHDKNGEEALRILNSVTQNHSSPDYYLLKAEIQDFMGNTHEMRKNKEKYYALVQDSSYGDMYNTYKVDYHLDFDLDHKQALNLAMKEVSNRPTPESYNLLAKTYLKMNKLDDAMRLVETEIIGKTYEPGILLNVAEIYKANRQYDKVHILKQELQGAIYELGPGSKTIIEAL